MALTRFTYIYGTVALARINIYLWDIDINKR